jgi:Ion transport protein
MTSRQQSNDPQFLYQTPQPILTDIEDMGKKEAPIVLDELVVDAGDDDAESKEDAEEAEQVEEEKSKKKKRCCKRKVSNTKRVTLKGNEDIIVRNLRAVSVAQAYDSISVKKATYLEIKLREITNKLHRIYKKYLTKGIEPNNMYRIAWDLVGMIFIMYNFLVIPFQISFDVDESNFDQVFSYMIDIFFIFDLIFNFFTGYIKRGTLIMEINKIRRHYLKTWFVFDLISSFPTYIVIVEVFKQQNDKNVVDFVRFIKLIRVFRLIRFLKLLKATKLKKFLSFLENFMNANQVLNSFLTLIMIIAFSAHWFGCIWHYVGIISLDSYSTNWMVKYGFQDNTVWERYVDSVYWAVTTMSTVGYGDITPSNPYERLVSIFAMLLAGSIHAYVLNKVQDIIKGSGNSSELYQ